MPSYIEHACVDCDKVRLVQTCYGKPRNLRCKSCSKAGANHPQYGKVGEDAAHWKGGTINCNGYFVILRPEHPRSMSDGYIKRAILVLEEKLGRPIREGHDSHHRNEIKTDDRPENLEELGHGAHSSLHIKKRKGLYNEPSLRTSRR